MDKYIALQDAADAIGVSRWTLRRAIVRGDLPAYRTSKQRISVREKDLEAYMSRRRIPTAERNA